MTVTLHMYLGFYAADQMTSSACRHALPSLKTSKDKAYDLAQHKYRKEYTYPCEKVEELLKILLEQSDETPAIWTNRTITAAACCPFIRFINYIQVDTTQGQHLHIERLKMGQNFHRFVYRHEYRDLKCLLPIEELESAKVFDLSEYSIEKSVTSFKAEHKPMLVRTLTYFARDTSMKGLALTLETESNQLNTYIWLRDCKNDQEEIV